jgi:hypothetical protein
LRPNLGDANQLRLHLLSVVVSSSSSIDGSLDVGLDAGGICGNTLPSGTGGICGNTLPSGTGDGWSESCWNAGTS